MKMTRHNGRSGKTALTTRSTMTAVSIWRTVNILTRSGRSKISTGIFSMVTALSQTWTRRQSLRTRLRMWSNYIIPTSTVIMWRGRTVGMKRTGIRSATAPLMISGRTKRPARRNRFSSLARWMTTPRRRCCCRWRWNL